ncbi:MAG: hypothetical protein H0W55_04175 [Actinobacteria bacterium]|nr:hypothetical protein [Actinomycetota bacterium]MDQ3531088.1 hypothetical protein [Actinomycetota bacterium]
MEPTRLAGDQLRLYAFSLFALVAPHEDVDQNAVVAQIKEGLAEGNLRWNEEGGAR